MFLSRNMTFFLHLHSSSLISFCKSNRFIYIIVTQCFFFFLKDVCLENIVEKRLVIGICLLVFVSCSNVLKGYKRFQHKGTIWKQKWELHSFLTEIVNACAQCFQIGNKTRNGDIWKSWRMEGPPDLFWKLVLVDLSLSKGNPPRSVLCIQKPHSSTSQGVCFMLIQGRDKGGSLWSEGWVIDWKEGNRKFNVQTQISPP